MKKTIAIVLSLASAVAVADFKLPDGYKKMTSAKRVCVKREVIEVGGQKMRVTYWNRDGKPDWILPPVETNALAHVKGKKQNNALENDAKLSQDVKKAKKNAAKKDAKNLSKAIDDLKKARDKSSDAMKAVYDPIIEMLEAEDNR